MAEVLAARVKPSARRDLCLAVPYKILLVSHHVAEAPTANAAFHCLDKATSARS